MEEPVQDYPPGQHLIGKKIKIKGSPHSRDLDQVEVTTEKVEGTTVKTTERNNQDRSESEAPIRTAPQNYSHQNNSWLEGGAESEYREAETHDRFPCFASRLASI